MFSAIRRRIRSWGTEWEAMDPSLGSAVREGVAFGAAFKVATARSTSARVMRPARAVAFDYGRVDVVLEESALHGRERRSSRSNFLVRHPGGGFGLTDLLS
jgi:hypothetical protein